MTKSGSKAAQMTYEAYLDEIATLLTEIYTMEDEAAIQLVMRAQADDFFTLHDDDPSLRTLEHAQEDVRTVFRRYKVRRARG